MTTAEQIQNQIAQLPEPLQQEALNFVEFLALKTEQNNVRQEEIQWMNASLTSAMCDIEQEGEPEYSESDCKELWQ